MKFTGLLLVCCLIGFGIYRVWEANSSSQYQVPTKRFFDTAQLLELKPFGEWDPDRHFSRDLSIVFYFSELSCQTCTTRELQNVARWHEQFGHRVDFYLVVQGQNPVYLNNLKRLGKVKYPILIEEHLGQLGFPETTLALFRKSSQEVQALYFPLPDQSHSEALTHFEKRLLQELGDPSPNDSKGRST